MLEGLHRTDRRARCPRQRVRTLEITGNCRWGRVALAGRSKAARHWSHVFDSHHPFVDVTHDRVTGKPYLDRARPGDDAHPPVTFGVPLDSHGSRGEQMSPLFVTAVKSRTELRQYGVFQSPFKPCSCDVNSKNDLLSSFGGEAGSVHHPIEGWLDPRHSPHLERRHESAELECRHGDVRGKCLIHTNGLLGVRGSHCVSSRAR